MSRYDKYEPKAGGFRAPIAAAWAASEIGKIFGVGLNASGQVVAGDGNTGVIGILCLSSAKAAGDIVDVMTSGELVEVTANDGTTALTAGTVYYADPTTGVLEASATGDKKVGFTVEATRLVVRLGDLAVPA